MQIRIPAGDPRALPRQAAARLQRLGAETTVTRDRIVEECRSRRAGDQFIHTWSARGLLVPSKWGSYYIPPERVAALALAARSSSHARLISWALTPPKRMGLPRRPCFMGPLLWEKTELSVSSPAPVLPLSPKEPRIPPTAPQLQAFAADLGWPTAPLEIRVGDIGKVQTKTIHVADLTWMLLLNVAPRIRAAGTNLLAHLSSRDRSRALDIRRLANFAALMPAGPRSLRPMVGPPGQYRLFAPRWYMVPHLRSLHAEARRPADG